MDADFIHHVESENRSPWTGSASDSVTALETIRDMIPGSLANLVGNLNVNQQCFQLHLLDLLSH